MTNPKPLIIDTREPHEYARSHAEGAINISTMEFMLGTVPSALKDVPKDTPIVLYCMTGQRSNTCGMLLRQYGFTDITNGINENRVKQIIATKS